MPNKYAKTFQPGYILKIKTGKQAKPKNSNVTRQTSSHVSVASVTQMRQISTWISLDVFYSE